MNRAVVVMAWVCSYFFILLPAATWATSKIDNITHSPGEAGDILEINEVDGQTVKIFLIDGDKPRLVLDFPDSEYRNKATGIATPGGKLVKGLRIGIHHTPVKKVRLVADLKSAEPLRWLEKYDEDSRKLTVTLLPADHLESTSPKVAVVSKDAVSEETPVKEPPAEGRHERLSAERTKVKLGAVKVEAAAVPAGEKPVIPQVKPSLPEEKKEADGAVPISISEQEDRSVKVPVLTSVNFDNAFSRSGEMVLLQLTDFEPPEISTQEKDPPRIFCDFSGAQVDKGLVGKTSTGGKYVETIRVEKEKMRVRVILDLVPGADYDLQQVYFKEDNLFVLIVNILAEQGMPVE